MLIKLEILVFRNLLWIHSSLVSTSVPGPSRWDGDENPGKIRFIVPKFWEKNRMRSATQPYCNNGWIRLCLTAHAIFFPKFWNDKTNFTRVFVTVSPRRPWDRGWFGFWNFKQNRRAEIQKLKQCPKLQAMDIAIKRSKKNTCLVTWKNPPYVIWG